ncbi:DUF4279 domain-containing protein [Paenibacillus yanchengensis]|uniref:DUF4279 domain-containing protein n=1 Tax=Paenibacillus yanchengensis TaxID=2035833 RepID=A0ABW4YQ80_9BACL
MSLLSGACSLLIRGEGLDKESIDNNLKITHTGYIIKGQSIKHSKITAPKDVWTYEMKFQQDEKPSTVLRNLIMKLIPVKNYLYDDKFEDICIRMYLQSEWAQMYFDLSAAIIKVLAELNIRFEVSILSWGGVQE